MMSEKNKSINLSLYVILFGWILFLLVVTTSCRSRHEIAKSNETVQTNEVDLSTRKTNETVNMVDSILSWLKLKGTIIQTEWNLSDSHIFPSKTTEISFSADIQKEAVKQKETSHTDSLDNFNISETKSDKKQNTEQKSEPKLLYNWTFWCLLCIVVGCIFFKIRSDK